MLRSQPDRRVRAILDLTEQVDLGRFGHDLRVAGRDKRARRAAVIGALERTAERQQARLTPLLDDLARQGGLDHWDSVAIVNRLLVEGTGAAILRLAESQEVARVLPDWKSEARASRGQEASRPFPQPGERFVSWAISAIGADSLWSRGLDGRGVVVASIDTGVYEDHEQLLGRRLDGRRGWFDPVQVSSRPFDNHGHGTGVLSQAVGGNPDGRVVGVAPGARWAAALGNWQNHYSRARMTLAADWALRVARPDVLINAWSHNEEECNLFDLPFINAWKAAEIFVVFPAGNAGPRSGSGEPPAWLAGTYPDGGPVMSVAGLDPSGEVYEESSRGPSRCGSTAFPTLAAPGADLPFAFPGGPRGYGVGHGTSFAAGIVGGAAALLLQADPELAPDEIERILVETARDVAPAGWDDASGAGAIDLRAAFDRLCGASGDNVRRPPQCPGRTDRRADR